MNVLASSYEPFGRDLSRSESFREWICERVPADKSLSNEIERWRTMSMCGWDLVALVAPDSKTVVIVGCR